jgi:RNA polymerase sigma factor (sigma-70 family)
MARSEPPSVLQLVRGALAARRARVGSDQELLARFLAERDEPAFAAIVCRHGPMVLDVCHGVLGNEADAEDAFQATFLVLAKKAGSIRSTASLASWLHGVAHRIALKARAEAARRRRHEARAPARQDAGPDLTWADARRALHEEVGRLSDQHRAPLVLCYLQGRTQDEAAALLGLSKGTLKRRLERGRALLRERLVRRGLGPAALLLASAWPGAAEAVPVALRAVTVKAVAWARGGEAAVPDRVAALAKGVTRTMLLTRLGALAGALLAVVLAAGAAVLALSAPAAEAPKTVKAGRPVLVDRPAARAEPRPVVVKTGGILRQVAWGRGNTLATVALALEVVEFKDGSGGFVAAHCALEFRDAKTGKVRRSPGEEKHTNLMAIAFSPDGKVLAVSAAKLDSEDPRKGKTEVRLVNVDTGALEHKVDLGEGAVSALVFSPDGTRLAIGGRGRLAEDTAFVRLWDVRKKKLIGGTEGGGHRTSCLAFSRDGALLAAGDEKGQVRLFDGRTGKLRKALAGHAQWVGGVGFSADGKALVSGGADRAVKLWDVETGKLRRELEGNRFGLTALAFSRDGRLFATAGGNKEVELLIWDAKTWKVKKSLPGQTTHVQALAFSPDGRTLAVAAGNGVRLGPNWPNGRIEAPGEFRLWPIE